MVRLRKPERVLDEALERKMEAMGVYLSDVVVLDGPEFAEARITIHNEWPRKKWAEYELTFTRNVPRPDWEKDL